MTFAFAGSTLFAPSFSNGWLWLAGLFTLGAMAAFARTRTQRLPPRPAADPAVATLREDSPAVVNMLTNDATVTAAGFRATMIDLAARGWLRILPPDDQDSDLGRVRPSATAHHGDTLRPHERLVLQHVLARFTTDRAIPARFLAVDIRGAWWRRFERLVVDDAVRSGLVRRRWVPRDLAVSAALWVVAAWCWRAAYINGDRDIAVIDSVELRIAGWSLALVLLASFARVTKLLLRPTYTHTVGGLVATRKWLAIRVRLASTGFADVAASSVDIGDRRLAYAAAMCLADGAAIELPLAREDHYRAWSTVGGTARLVRIRYPARVAYGIAPLTAIVVGLLTCFAGLRLRAWADDVARGDGFDAAYERFPDQDWLIADIATGLTFLTVAPILIGLWMALAGAVDATNPVERTGAVIRTRRPSEVSPLPQRVQRLVERDRYRLYMAVDDASSDTLVAWKTGERNAVPQGARAAVSATRVLGHVRRSSPVGHVPLS